MAGRGMHGKDVEDVRPISGMFYLQTYLGEEYPVTGNFNYIPFISVNDAYLNNNLTYRLDGSTQVSGWDGSVISFNGEGVRYLTGVNFFTKVNGQIIEDFATTFQFNKKQAKIAELENEKQDLQEKLDVDTNKFLQEIRSNKCF